MIHRRRGTAGLAAAAAVLPTFAAEPAHAAIVAPPEPAEVETLFREACWQGLRDPAVFRRGVQSSSLDFRRVEDAEPVEHHGGRASAVEYVAGARCTVRAHLRRLDAAEDIVRRMSAFGLQQIAAPPGESGLTRAYRSAQMPASGGSVAVELVFTPPPPPRRYRLPYPPAFTLSISAYFAPNE